MESKEWKERKISIQEFVAFMTMEKKILTIQCGRREISFVIQEKNKIIKTRQKFFSAAESLNIQ